MNNSRLGRLVLIVVLLLGLAYFAAPTLRQHFFAATAPRAVEPRGELASWERTTITLFEQSSPAVVQVVALRGGGNDMSGLDENAQPGVGTGTGFLWDDAGNIVINAHVVAGAQRVAVRMASGAVIGGEIAGVAPNYDVAVIRLARTGTLPRPLPIGSSADLKVG